VDGLVRVATRTQIECFTLEMDKEFRAISVDNNKNSHLGNQNEIRSRTKFRRLYKG